MTINRVIERLGQVKPHGYEDTVVAAWVAEADGRVALEIMHREAIDYGQPDTWDQELLVPPPYDGVYEQYAAAMVDYYNREYGEYNNSMMMFAQTMKEYAAWYIRNHMPPSAGYYREVL